MKKLISIIVFFFIFSSQIYSSNYNLTVSDKIIINKLSFKIQKLLDTNSLLFRININNKIDQLQNKYKYSKKIYNIFQEIKKNTHLINYENEYNNHYKSMNIDFSNIKNNWLNWHNVARKNLSRKLYTYDRRLDNTSYEWSKTQEKDKKMSHKRTKNAPYYDYHAVEKWFNNRGVRCNAKGRTTTSESIGKFGYYCSNNNCTDKLLESLNVIFDIYMAEKGMGYPADAHYRGIISDNLSKIGLGISIRKTNEKDYYEYYVTTHYCTEFKK